MISLNRFYFRGKSSQDFDVLVDLAFESDSGATETFLNKEAMTSTIYDGSKYNIHGYKYNEVLAPQFTLIKKDYSDFTETENRKILAWLTGSNKVERMVCYQDDSQVVSFVLYGNIIQVEQHKIANKRIVGYTIVFENNAPYAYSPVKTITKTVTAPQVFDIDCRTDVFEKNIYPKITVTMGDSKYLPIDENPTADTYEMLDNVIYEYKSVHYIRVNGQKHVIQAVPSIAQVTVDSSTYNRYYFSFADDYVYKGVLVNEQYGWEKITKVGIGFEIKNTYYQDGRDVNVKATVVGCHTNEVITIDGDNRLISSSDNQDSIRIIGNDFNWEWIYFIPDVNHVRVSGNCTITFEWVEPLKIGNV